jgi:hypothetical protein
LTLSTAGWFRTETGEVSGVIFLLALVAMNTYACESGTERQERLVSYWQERKPWIDRPR